MMKCPKCGKPYISRSAFSEEPPIDVVIHKQKRKRIKMLGVGSQYVNEPSEICFITKESDDETHQD